MQQATAMSHKDKEKQLQNKLETEKNQRLQLEMKLDSEMNKRNELESDLEDRERKIEGLQAELDRKALKESEKVRTEGKSVRFVVYRRILTVRYLQGSHGR